MATATSLVGRAAAVLTNGTVYGADCDLSDSLDGKLSVDLTFTLDTLTSVTLICCAGNAANPTDPLWVNGQLQTISLTGNTEAAMVFDCGGYRYARLSALGVGAVGASSLAYTYYYNDYEGTTKVDGEVRVG